jgi:hypothetical protein
MASLSRKTIETLGQKRRWLHDKGRRDGENKGTPAAGKDKATAIVHSRILSVEQGWQAGHIRCKFTAEL